MIRVKHAREASIFEMRMEAPVTAEDYNDILMPALDEAIVTSEKLRFLAVVEAGISDFSLGAMLQDARLGLKHWSGFDRAAIVSDNDVLKGTIKAFSVFFPCPVDFFKMDDIEAARRWLRESLGTVHQTELGNGVIQLSMRGQLDSAAIENAVVKLNASIATQDSPRLLIDLTEFDGWQGLGALRDHFVLARHNAPRISRVAFLGSAGWQEMATQVGKRILGLDARFFDEDEHDAARTWLNEQ